VRQKGKERGKKEKKEKKKEEYFISDDRRDGRREFAGQRKTRTPCVGAEKKKKLNIPPSSARL